MTKVHFIQADGREIEVDVHNGDSLMQGAVDAMVGGIVAECGGGLNCATCHVYVDEEWLPTVGEAMDMEKDLLEATPSMRTNSRLSCQIEVTPELEGLIVRVPTEYA
jgi:ferredoxin, 2Fe-2S